MTRQAYVLHEHKLVVFWARKAACTSIVDAVLFDVLGQDEAEFEAKGLRKRPWLKENGYEHGFMSAALQSRDPDYRSIGMIRDPYDRLISVYLNTFVRNEGEPVLRFSDLAGFSRRFYCEITGWTEDKANPEYRGLSFFDFVSAVCDRIDRRRLVEAQRRFGVARTNGIRRAIKRPWMAEPVLDPHWGTQVPFWYRASGFRYDFLYRMDQSPAFFKKLGELTGADIAVKRRNASDYSRTGAAAGAPDLVHANPMSYASDPASINKACFGSDALRKRVLRAFAPDYHYLKTCLPTA